MNRIAVLAHVVGMLICVFADPKEFQHGVRLPTRRPLNIAHRGSSGTFPEHTAEAYLQAIRDGADVIECDVSVTKDLQLVCLHDTYLSEVTDVADHPEFADRKTVKASSGKDTANWFSVDFTFDELLTLKVVQRMSIRDQSHNGKFNITRFSDFMQIAKNAERPIGIYPEIKDPEFVNSLDIMAGKRMEDLFLESLEEFGYTKADDPCFIQSFSENSLKYLVNKTELPLIILIWLDEHYLGPNLNESKLPEWGTMFYGIGAWKPQVAIYYDDINFYKNWISGQTDLLKEVRDAGLKFHLYTFRNEDKYLAWDFHQDPYEEYDYFMELDIDGYFTDFPRTFSRYLDTTYATTGSVSAAGSVFLRSKLGELTIFTVALTIFSMTIFVF